MKTFISLPLYVLFLCSFSGLTHAGQCALNGFTEKNMRLSGYLHSQTASSFRVKCDRAYNIRFRSMNLRNANGDSFVSNGARKISTFMRIEGADKSEWNALLSPKNSFDNKFSVIVELIEKPNVNTPAGTYSDKIYIDLFFKFQQCSVSDSKLITVINSISLLICFMKLSNSLTKLEGK